jgi:hypothetical protein
MRILGTPATHQQQQPTVKQLATITVISTPTPMLKLTLTRTLTLTLIHILTEKIWTVT